MLIENFKTGTMERWNLGYADVLSQRYPRLIHCRISGFGADGPMGGLVGYDAALQAMTGLMSVNGNSRHRAAAARHAGGRSLDRAPILAGRRADVAIYARNVSGHGQYIDMTLHDCGLAMLHPQGRQNLGIR